MAAYAYARVSTDRQADEGQSLGAQARQVEGYAMMHGITINEHFVERGISGSVPFAERPESKRLLSILKRGDVVVTPKLDRAFRSASDALAMLDVLTKKGVALHMIDIGGDVTSNGISKLVFTILSAVAENERDRICERITVVKTDQRARGRYLGGKLPFGYEVMNGNLVPVESQQEAICEMIALRAKGLSLRAISVKMKAEGHYISHTAVKEILDRLQESNSSQ